ncbi:MAG: hypothetical protein K6G18_06830 [Treponema sp.]|nr:hypothetical protein [Treponema sp.]
MIPILVAFLAGITAFAVVAFWSQITEWLTTFIPQVKKKIRESLAKAQAVFARVVSGAFRIIHKFLYKDDRGWVERTTERELEDENEVPEDIRAAYNSKKKANGEANVTSAMEKELDMTI